MNDKVGIIGIILIHEGNSWNNLSLEFGEIHFYCGNLLVVQDLVLKLRDGDLIYSLILYLKDIPVEDLILDKILLPQERLT